MDGVPRGVALVAVLQADVLQVLELAVVVGELHLQLALRAGQRLGVEHGLSDDEVDGRG